MSKKAAVYLLLGPEAGEKSDFLDTLRGGLEKRSGEKPEETRFYPFEAAAADVIAYLRNGSLFSAHRIALVDGVELYRKKEDIEALARYCESPADDATLVLLSEQTKMEPRLDKAVPQDQKKIFWEMFDNQKLGWLTNYLRRKGAKISADAANLLLELVENNTQELRRESDRLVLFFGKDHEISADDIETYVYHSKGENVFSLFESVAALDFTGSLEIIQSILLGSEGNAVQLMAGLMWQFRNLLAIKSLLAERVSIQEAFQRVKVRGKKAQRNYQAAERNFSLEAVEHVIMLGGRYDELFRRTGAALHPMLLELFLYAVVIRKGDPPEAELREKGDYEL